MMNWRVLPVRTDECGWRSAYPKYDAVMKTLIRVTVATILILAVALGVYILFDIARYEEQVKEWEERNVVEARTLSLSEAPSSLHKKGTSQDFETKFGTCCNDIWDAMQKPPKTFFTMGDDGVLYLTVGYAKTQQGTGYFEAVVNYCPFCGTRLQAREQVEQSPAAK
jgi:hypothetical protein